MAYDLEEQDQIDALKTWWKTNGNLVTWAAIVAMVSFTGMQGWKYYQHQQSTQASAQYQLLTQVDSKDLKSIQGLSGQLMEKYTSTPYAGRAALIAAKANFAAKDSKSAKAQLQWAAKNSKEDAIKSIALLQLAAIQLEEKAYDDALKTLSENHSSGFDGLFADLKGDVLVAQGKNSDAKLAYQEALTKLDPQGHYRRFTAHKLEALGS
ncbi:MAG TPA: tetratricopeptide repeat protein [Methylophilaceae bacterium]|jgi:predicted negative regulator of RcsB-dependent stress response